MTAAPSTYAPRSTGDFRDQLLQHARTRDVVCVRFVTSNDRGRLFDCVAVGYVTGVQPATALILLTRGTVTIVSLRDVVSIEVLGPFATHPDLAPRGERA